MSDGEIWHWVHLTKKEKCFLTHSSSPINAHPHELDEKSIFLFLRRLIRAPLDPVEVLEKQESLTVCDLSLMTDEEMEEADWVWELLKEDETIPKPTDPLHPYHKLVRKRGVLEKEREQLKNYGVRFDGRQRVPSRLTIYDLPLEIISVLFDMLDEYFLALSFALTSTYFWKIGKRHLMRRLRSPGWAGTRDLACVSSKHNPIEYAGIRTKPQEVSRYRNPAPETRIHDSWFDYVDEASQDSYSYDEQNENENSVSKAEEIQIVFDSQKNIMEDVVAKCAELKSWVRPFAPETHSLLSQYGCGTSSGDMGSVVRNLDKKEFCRREWRTTKDPFRRGQERYDPTSRLRSLAMKLFVQLRWADDSEKGKWIGDRIDIVQWEERELAVSDEGEVVEEEGWRDVTDEINAELFGMMRAAGRNEWGERI
ncbi:hypothetical protein V5O48_010323 [Marasmius crinis-equi]|uniref:F-box domain-containing protein n=1 Tax=Marasmius crinis-equi TaxID=585013 RepID=A0ABR3F8Q6_9AGAR